MTAPAPRRRAPAPPVLPVSLLVSSARLLARAPPRRSPGSAARSPDFTRAASGHCLLHAEGRARRRCSCVLFRQQGAARRRSRCATACASRCARTPTIYEARGEFQLNVDAVRLAGLGALYERFARLKAKLEAAGWFDAERKRALPAYPRAVGIVTSPRAAALRDVLTTLARRWPAAARDRLSDAGAGRRRGRPRSRAAIRIANAARRGRRADRLPRRRLDRGPVGVQRGGGRARGVRVACCRSCPASATRPTSRSATSSPTCARRRPPRAAALVVPDRAAFAHQRRPARARAWRAPARTRWRRARSALDHAARRLVHPAARLARSRSARVELALRLARAGARRIARRRATLRRARRPPAARAARAAAAGAPARATARALAARGARRPARAATRARRRSRRTSRISIRRRCSSAATRSSPRPQARSSSTARSSRRRCRGADVRARRRGGDVTTRAKRQRRRRGDAVESHQTERSLSAFVRTSGASSGSGSSTPRRAQLRDDVRAAPAPRCAASATRTSAFCARWRSAWSISTIAIIASAIGVARMPTHGSWRPCVLTIDRLARLVDRMAVEPDRRRRLHRDRHDDVLAGRDAAEDAAGVVGQEALRRHLVGVLGAALRDRREAGADLDALHRVDAHHRVRRGRRRACRRPARPSRPARRSRRPRCARRRVARLAQPVHERLELGDHRRVGDEERIGVDVRRSPRTESTCGPSCVRWPRIAHAVALAQPLLRDRARGDAHGGLARRLPSAAAVVADAVLLPVRVVGVAGTERVGDVRVVLAARVLVADQQRDRRAGRAAFEHAGEDLHRVRLAPLRDVPRRAGPAAIELALDVGFGERQSRRTAVDDAADRRPVRFAERGDAEQRAERVA